MPLEWGHCQRLRDLGSEAEGVVDGQLAALEPNGQRFAIQQFHDQIIRTDIVEGTNVGMAYRCDGARLLLETVEECFFANLDRYRSGQARVGSAEHVAHSSLAEQRINSVRAQPEPGRDGLVDKVRDEIRCTLIEEFAAAMRVVRQQLFDLSANLGVSTVENRNAMNIRISRARDRHDLARSRCRSLHVNGQCV
jgi:hypothetical protein